MKSTTVRLIITGLALVAALWALVPTYTARQLDVEIAALKQRNDTAGIARFYEKHGRDYRDREKNFLAPPIKLGLDLQGGMYVTMEVDLPGLIEETATKEAVDDLFHKVIDSTRAEASLTDQPVLEIFQKQFDKIARPTGKTMLDYFEAGVGGGDVSEDAVLKRLARNIEDAVDQAVEVMRQRIDKYGVSETSIQKIAGRRIVLELPGVTDAESVRKLLQTTARLEFKLVKNDIDALTLFARIDQALAGKVIDTAAAKKTDSTAARTDSTKKPGTAQKADSGKKGDVAKKPDSTKKGDVAKKPDSTKKGDLAKKDSTKKGDSTKKKSDSTPGNDSGPPDPYKGLSQADKEKAYKRDHPFTSYMSAYSHTAEDTRGQEISGIFMYPPEKFASMVPKDAQIDFYIPRDSLEKVKMLLARPELRGLIPPERMIAFDAHAEQASGDASKGFYHAYVLNSESELSGDVVSDAAPSNDPQTGRPEVVMDMNSDGADKWSEITGRNVQKRIAIVLDSAVYSAPTVITKIDGGRSSISGSKDIAEANLLAIILKSGSLKAPVKIIEERIVGPSLGEDSIAQGVTATGIAALLVILFMLVYYVFGGFVADVAVMLNVLITLAVLAAFNATLTLPGIGGLVLTIGMAVDGNILIYERIREEMARGKALKSAVLLGYDKAFTAIIDTHITTFMTGAILYAFGSGPIRGFAVTLMVGIAATLFTAVFVTKTVFMVMLERGSENLNYGQVKEVST